MDPPDDEDEEGKAAFAEEQEDFLKKWRSPVKSAYKKKYPKVIIFKITSFSPGFHCLRTGGQATHFGVR